MKSKEYLISLSVVILIIAVLVGIASLPPIIPLAILICITVGTLAYVAQHMGLGFFVLEYYEKMRDLWLK